MKTIKIFCLILAFVFFKASGIDNELQEHLNCIEQTTGQAVTGKEYLAFTLFGGCFTNIDCLEKLCMTREGCEIQSFQEKLNKSNIVIHSEHNCTNYLVYKKSPSELKILYSTEYSLQPPCSSNLLYSHLISNAFSSADIQNVTIHSPIFTEYFGNHVEYLKLECRRSGADINVSFNIFDSLKNRDRSKDDEKIARCFTMGGSFNWFKKFRIQLSPIDPINYHTLGVQSCIGSDCNVFVNAFLVINWLKDIDPRGITDYRLLHKVMQKMIDLEIVFNRTNDAPRDLFGSIMGLIERTSKYMGALQRYELDHPSVMWKRIPKLFIYKATELGMRATVGTGEFILAMLGLE